MDEMIARFNQGQWKEELNSPFVQWGGVLCVILMGWLFLLDPYLTWRSDVADEIEQQQLQLSKLDRVINSQSEIAQAMSQINGEYETAKRALTDEKTSSRAISAQVDLFQSFYQKANLKFAGRRFGNADIEPWLGEQVNSSWRVTGSSDDILELIYQLAQSSALIEMTSFEIKPGVNTRTSRKRVQNPDEKQEKTYELATDLRSYRLLPLKEIKAKGGIQ